jgi:hypothetical protein
VPWRFSDAGRQSAWVDRRCRRPKTCTEAASRTANLIGLTTGRREQLGQAFAPTGYAAGFHAINAYAHSALQQRGEGVSMSDSGEASITWRMVVYGLVGGAIIVGVVLLVQIFAWKFPFIVLGLIAIPLIFSQTYRALFLGVLPGNLVGLGLLAVFVLAVASCSLR